METLKLFNYDKTPLKINKPIRLIELFAGVGSQAKALQRLGANFEHYKISEWEINATASYKAIHKGNDNTDYSAEFTDEQLAEILFNIGVSTDGKKPLTLKEIARKNEQWKRTVYNNFKATNNIGSILNVSGAELGVVDTDKFTYLLTYSFPCQDLSLAGKQKGMAKGENTRSGLLWEVERLLNECNELPQILLMENVTQVHGTKNKEHFNNWCEFLESKGYTNYWKDLNAKNFGIPQNRNRTFMASVLGGYTYDFPKEFPLELRLKDMLEDSVDKKFYLSDAMINYFTENTIKQREKGNGFKFQPTDGDCVGKAVTTRAGGRMDDNFIEEQPLLIGGMQKNQGVKKDGVSTTLTASMGCGGGYVPMVIDPIRLGGLFDTDKSKHQAGSVGEKEAISPTVDTMQGGYRQPLIVEDFYKNHDERVYENYAPAIRSERNGPKVVEPLAYDEQNGYIRKDGTVGTLTTDGSSPKHNNRVIENCYVSEKGVKFICSPKRGMTTDVNADICQPLTAKGQANWTGSFVSPDIENLEKSSTIGSTEPTKINLKSGETITSNDSLFGIRIRKLTPKECWRLMGFDDIDFDKASSVNSNSQLYKQAGNSIVVDVLCYIFREML